MLGNEGLYLLHPTSVGGFLISLSVVLACIATSIFITYLIYRANEKYIDRHYNRIKCVDGTITLMRKFEDIK